MPYHNPILPGFYPDPSVCRVGDDFYLVNSSFEYFPGVPIWHSRDLVHWRQLGHVLDRPSQLALGSCKCSDGIYAPTLRHHRGVFYMITTLVVGGEYRNFYVTATNPAGPWSEPVFYDQNGIDPSLFFDDDGKVYFQSNRGLTFKMPRAIYQSEIDLATGRRLTEPRVLWAGSGGCYVEGPHLYKRNGWYYLLTAEGGTAYGHMVAIARSRSPWGPFEGCPHNPILSNRHAYEELHGTGHGDLVEAPDGTWWMVHLAFRKTVDDVHTLGRETCLAPVAWIDDWPVVNHTATNSLLVSAPTLPPAPVPAPSPRDDFDSPRLALEWIHLRNPAPDSFNLTERPGWLRLRGNTSTLDELAAPAFAGRRQQHFAFTSHTRLDFSPARDTDEAGLTLLMTNQHRYDCFVTRRGARRVLIVRYVLELIRHTAAEIELPEGPVDLRLTGTKLVYTFAWSRDGAAFQDLASVNTRYLGTEVTGGYNGVILGLYATGGGTPAPADFDFFTYVPAP